MATRNIRVTRMLGGAAAFLALAVVVSCGGDDSNTRNPPAVGTSTLTPIPTPTPTPPPPPFGLVADRTFDTFGWDGWPDNLSPSTVQLRWDSSAAEYQLLEDGYSDWAALKLQESPPHTYSVVSADGNVTPTKVAIQPSSYPFGPNTGRAGIYEDSKTRTTFAFGIATEAGDVPKAGEWTCNFGWEEIVGLGSLTLDFTAGTATGWFELNAFLPLDPNGNDLTNVTLRPNDEIIVTANYRSSPDNVLEARFYGPNASEIVVRARGEISGLMAGKCKG